MVGGCDSKMQASSHTARHPHAVLRGSSASEGRPTWLVAELGPPCSILPSSPAASLPQKGLHVGQPTHVLPAEGGAAGVARPAVSPGAQQPGIDAVLTTSRKHGPDELVHGPILKPSRRCCIISCPTCRPPPPHNLPPKKEKQEQKNKQSNAPPQSRKHRHTLSPHAATTAAHRCSLSWMRGST
jgi:hypothetical protein